MKALISAIPLIFFAFIITSVRAEEYFLIRRADCNSVIQLTENTFQYIDVQCEALLDGSDLYLRKYNSHNKPVWIDLKKINFSDPSFPADQGVEFEDADWGKCKATSDKNRLFSISSVDVKENGDEVFVLKANPVQSRVEKGFSISLPSKLPLSQGIHSSDDILFISDNEILIFDFEGTPNLFRILDQSFASNSFVRGRGKYHAKGFHDKNSRKSGSVSISNGFDRVADITVWDSTGKIIVEKEFLLGFGHKNFWADLSSLKAFFLNENVVVVWVADQLILLHGASLDGIERCQLELPSEGELLHVWPFENDKIGLICGPSDENRNKKPHLAMTTITVASEPKNGSVVQNGFRGWRLLERK